MSAFPKAIRHGIRLVLLLAVPMLVPGWGYAHGVGYTIEAGRKTMVLNFQYSTGEPMAYAETLVFSPENSVVEYQNGRTDQSGNFAFAPNTGGKWRVSVSDGRGHKVTAELEVAGQDKPATASEPVADQSSQGPTAGPLWFRAAFGVSLIFNLAFILLFIKRKKDTAKC